MDIDEKLKIVKDIKTAARLTKQVRTMLNNMANKISAEDTSSICASNLLHIAQSLSDGCDNLDNNIQLFKKEQKVGGYQLSFDF